MKYLILCIVCLFSGCHYLSDLDDLGFYQNETLVVDEYIPEMAFHIDADTIISIDTAIYWTQGDTVFVEGAVKFGTLTAPGRTDINHIFVSVPISTSWGSHDQGSLNSWTTVQYMQLLQTATYDNVTARAIPSKLPTSGSLQMEIKLERYSGFLTYPENRFELFFEFKYILQ